MYEIRSRDLKRISHCGASATRERYDELRAAILNPDSWLYGSVLVTLRRRLEGINVRVRVEWRRPYWRPRGEVRWIFTPQLHWLWFHVWLDGEYRNVVDTIIRDHLSEAQQ